MTKVRIFTPENRLAKTLVEAAESNRAELLRGAEVGLDRLEPELLDDIARDVRRIVEIAARGDEAVRASASEITQAAIGITDLAVGQKSAALGAAARGLADLMDILAQDGAWRSEVFILHVEALGLIFRQGGKISAYQRMLDDLKLSRDTVVNKS